ncbi:response regulator transcription factor [Paenibacillus albicereus]|uniref:response regulator transcription factor n=1 Tax=Paenibacillus albicereus TaxID=2726185 RepID=UPI002E2BAC42|nr:response regulator [Paenibacillus albicereus]
MRYKVLLVDDEELDLKGMLTFIPWERLGLEVAGAVHNGYAAYELLERERVDILVTDVHMPSMNGLELAEKALALYGSLRVIFVSGYQDFQYVKQALQLRAWGYVLKPMDDQELEAALLKLVQQLDAEKEALAAAAPADSTAKEEPRPSGAGKGSSKNAKLIVSMMAFIEDHLHENLTLKLLADEFSFSPNYLGALFKEETGVNFSEHLIDRRMHKAGELLRETRLRIYEIADKVGYRYMPYFSRQFKETFGVTPNEFRRMG